FKDQNITIKTNTSFSAKLIFSKTKKELFLLKNYIELSNDILEEITIEKETVEPTSKLIDEIRKALEHHDPYNKLIDIFNSYGHFIPKKMIFEHKLYRKTCLTADKSLSELIDKIEIK
ncbi:3692_t:CDS:2, partial [Dentiscutata erythropus]